MTEFNDEQKKEIQTMIAQQQWAIAGMDVYNEAIEILNTKVQRGTKDPYVLQVAQALKQAFLKANFTQPQQEQKDEAPASD